MTVIEIEPIDIISRVQASLVRQTVLYHQKKVRFESQRILVEGQHPVSEALLSKLPVESLFILEDTEERFQHLLHNQPFYSVTEEVMARLATTDTPPPIMGIFHMPAFADIDSVFQQTHGDILALNRLSDPGNVGTLIRSACAFSCSSLLWIGAGVDPFQPKVIRASAGMIFRLPMAVFPTEIDFLTALGRFPDKKICVTQPRGGLSYTQVPSAPQQILILGEEAHGVDPLLMQAAQGITIPMTEGVESLNVAQAGSILLSYFYQQRL
jgi:RNA methyltransferase, TrmH family